KTGLARHWALPLAAALGVLVGYAGHLTLSGAKPTVATPAHLFFSRPVGTELTNTGRQILAISPDGTKVVFVSNNQLYLRKLDATDAAPIRGTEDTFATTPVFSPDGRSVAFFARATPNAQPDSPGELRRVPVEGGAAVQICGSIDPNFGASWTSS